MKTISINDDELHNALCIKLSRKQWSVLLAGINDLHLPQTIGVHMLTKLLISFRIKLVYGKYPMKAVILLSYVCSTCVK